MPDNHIRRNAVALNDVAAKLRRRVQQRVRVGVAAGVGVLQLHADAFMLDVGAVEIEPLASARVPGRVTFRDKTQHATRL